MPRSLLSRHDWAIPTPATIQYTKHIPRLHPSRKTLITSKLLLYTIHPVGVWCWEPIEYRAFFLYRPSLTPQYRGVIRWELTSVSTETSSKSTGSCGPRSQLRMSPMTSQTCRSNKRLWLQVYCSTLNVCACPAQALVFSARGVERLKQSSQEGWAFRDWLLFQNIHGGGWGMKD